MDHDERPEVPAQAPHAPEEKLAYEPPRVGSVQLSQEAAEALT
jgi:hypothetical protein